MTTLSLREAAAAAGVNKSSIFRAIKSGRLSAGRTDDGDYAIDPAEVMRVYPAKPEMATRQDATGEAVELRVRTARLEAEVAGLREMLDEMRRTRDAFERQVTALTAALPKPMPAAHSEPPGVVPRIRSGEGRGWWPFRRAG